MLGMALPQELHFTAFPPMLGQGWSGPCILLLLFTYWRIILTFVSKCRRLLPPRKPNTNTLIIQCLGHSPSNRDKNQHIQGTRKKRQCKSESANVSNMLVRQAFLNAPQGCSQRSYIPDNLDNTSPPCEGPPPFCQGASAFSYWYGNGFNADFSHCPPPILRSGK